MTVEEKEPLRPKIFISGPMTGMPDWNRPKFNQIQQSLEELGYVCLNPAILPLGMSEADYWFICQAMLRRCDYILFLDGYQQSKGAQFEKHIAKIHNIKAYELVEENGRFKDFKEVQL